MKKIALVTGAAKGLGFEWCRQLALSNYEVVLTARSMEKAQKAADKLQQENLNCIPLAVDVSSEQQIENLASNFKKQFTHLDLLVNNAGINSKDSGNQELFMKSFRLESLDAGEVLRHIHINGIAPIILLKHFMPMLAESVQPIVVNISSWLGSIGEKDFGGHYGYATSKAALNMMTRAAALEIRKEGIIVVAVNPGWVQTDMGGSSAKLTPAESVSGIISNVVNKLTLEDTGRFLQWNGSGHAW